VKVHLADNFFPSAHNEVAGVGDGDTPGIRLEAESPEAASKSFA
jgi:hypothetical protein